MKYSGKSSKNKKILGVFIIVILIGIAIAIIKTRDRTEWIPYELDTNIENIIFSEVSSENLEDIVYIVDENIRVAGNYFPDYYIVQLSQLGRRSVDLSPTADSFIFEFERVVFRVYNLRTKDLAREFDVLEILEGFEGMMEDYALRRFDAQGVRINDQLYVYAILNRRLEDNTISIRESHKILLINIGTGEYRLEEWNYQDEVQEINSREFDVQMSFFDGVWDSGFLSRNEFHIENFFDFRVSPFHLQSDTIRIMLSSNNLPENNDRLYTLFPNLEQFRDQEGARINIILTGGHWTAEELLSLFMEDGQEISFEGVIMSGDASIDGEEHEIHSFEDYFRLRDFSEFDNE